jgi:hypothetical protein
MDPNIMKMFNEMLKKMEDLDARSTERWGHLEKWFEDATATILERDDTVDASISSLESFASS